MVYVSDISAHSIFLNDRLIDQPTLFRLTQTTGWRYRQDLLYQLKHSPLQRPACS